MGAVATGVGGAAKGGVALVKAGVSVGTKTAEAMAQSGVKMTNGTRLVLNGKVDLTQPLSPLGTWKPGALLKPTEARKLIDDRLPEGEVLHVEKADALNADVLAKDSRYKPPYVQGTEAVTVKTIAEEKFVRLYVDSEYQSGSWMMRESDIKGLTAEQIASKYALPQVPTMRTDVTLPPGQQLRVTVANDIQIKQGIGGNGGGGGVQFEVLTRPEKTSDFEKWFSNPRPLK